MCTQYHTTEGCSTNYSDVDEDKHQAGENEVQPQTGTPAGEDSIWGLPKGRRTAAKLSTVALGASTEMRPHPLAKTALYSVC